MSYPDNDKSERDLARFVDTIYRDQDGNVKQDALYWAGHGVRSDQIGAASAHREGVKILLERLPLEMPATIATVLGPQLDGMMRELDAAIAGKNSETLYYSKHGPEAVSSLRDLISKRTTEYIHSGDNTDAAKSWMDRLGGKGNDQEREG